MTWQDCLDELIAERGKRWVIAQLGTRDNVVWAWLKGIAAPNAANKDRIKLLYQYPERDDRLKEELADAVARGWSLADIAEEYEVSEEKAALWLRIYDL